MVLPAFGGQVHREAGVAAYWRARREAAEAAREDGAAPAVELGR